MKKSSPQPGLPTRDQILRFIETSSEAVGKREIAKHFALHGNDKIALKALLKDMTDEGLVDLAPGRAFHKHGGLPRVTVLRVTSIDGSTLWAVPEHWEAAGPAPRLRRNGVRRAGRGYGPGRQADPVAAPGRQAGAP